MADNLPLIPDKGSAVCTDVRPVLREVFRELDILPPLTTRPDKYAVGDNNLSNDWEKQYNQERQEIWDEEGDLKQQHAKRLAREPLPNIYKLHEPSSDKKAKGENKLLDRKDLIPTLVQNACKDQSLWIKNILNTSSSQFQMEVKGSRYRLPLSLPPDNEYTEQTLSIGRNAPRSQPPAPSVPTPPPHFEQIVCVPPLLEFVNFTIGNLYTQQLRLINLSTCEVRLSVRPPKRQELDVEITGTRGLTVTSGAAAEFKIHFRPQDVRRLRDVLLIRVSTGNTVELPILCYMQPPLLNIIVPAISANCCWNSELKVPAPGSRDVIELGAQLLGDVHSTSMTFYCDAEHASFFIMSEDDWVSFTLSDLTRRGSLVSGTFVLFPVWFLGGGVVTARVWCRADVPGLHTTALRILCSTAIVRPMYLLADSLYFREYHLTVEAFEKIYDILSDSDEGCNHYIHLGTAFPNRPLSAVVQIINHSPVDYSFYWSSRRWGVCSCWREFVQDPELDGSDLSEELCPGAKVDREREGQGISVEQGAHQLLRVQTSGRVLARSSTELLVKAPDVGAELGTQRAVIMLVLRNIPKDCFPPKYEPMIVSTRTVESEPIPGVESWSRELCEIVFAQIEVWWEVVPVRFVLDPPILPITHSRRVTSVEMCITATQLYGLDPVLGMWEALPRVPLYQPVIMRGGCSRFTTIHYPLPSLPNEYPETDTIRLRAVNNEWLSVCSVSRQCGTRHPALRPARALLGVVPPAAPMHCMMRLTNDTHQHICWWGTAHRWVREYQVSAPCAGRAPCPRCFEQTCTCGILRPARGALPHGASVDIAYNVNAPSSDGCVATLVSAQRTSADVSLVHGGAGTAGRATLLAYRVLAPRLVLRITTCYGPNQETCMGCEVDGGEAGREDGTAVLRPARALSLAGNSCYRLSITNITPIPTYVTWEKPLEDDVLKVLFIPNEFYVEAYGRVETQVVLHARRVTGRRLFVFRAQVQHAYWPMYLVIDTAIDGLEMMFEMPIGEEEVTSSKLIFKLTQREEFPWDANKQRPIDPQEIFAYEDFRRLMKQRMCHCTYEMCYIPPLKPLCNPESPRTPEILTEPPSLTRVCSCYEHTRPVLVEHAEPLCLQFKEIPIRTVRGRTLTLRNVSLLTAKWSTAVRHWPRHPNKTISKDQWAGEVRAPGLAVQCAPHAGVLPGGATAELRVLVYADCWGLYREQILIHVESLEPVVLDVWVEALGAPLVFALSPREPAPASRADPVPVQWFSLADPKHVLRVKNESRAPFTVYAYTVTEHEHVQDKLPFRLYLRLHDLMPRSCACMTSVDSQEDVKGPSCSTVDMSESSYEEEMDTGVELYLAEDFGLQDGGYYTVSPEVCAVAPDSWVQWTVTLKPPPAGDLAPPSALLLRTVTEDKGWGWFRPEPRARTVQLRHAPRAPLLALSRDRLAVRLCALDLPLDDTLRVRKHLLVRNMGNGSCSVCAVVAAPWTAMARGAARRCGGGCGCLHEDSHAGDHHLALTLPPRASMEVSVEVEVVTARVWPADRPYEPRRTHCTEMRFYDEYNLITKIPLVLELEFPVIFIEPETIDFGFVTDGDTRKSYFTVSHSSRSESIHMVAAWVGPREFSVWPPHFTLRPGAAQRLYLQYTARWMVAPVEGYAEVSAACGGGAWCGARGAARAAPARDLGAHRPPHDHTTDPHLLPPLATRHTVLPDTNT